MASIGTTNIVYPAYRNSTIGKTADYSTRVDADTDTLFAFFTDEGTTAADETHIFVSSLTAAENPAIANKQTITVGSLAALTNSIAAAGFVTASSTVFTGSSVLTGSTSVEKLIVAKFITNAAASPLLVHFGTATGLSGGLTPNGADVTVVWNASGIYKF